MASNYTVKILGPFTLFRDGQRVETDKWQRRIECLFKLLATAPEHRRLRDEIIDLLWPDAAPDAGDRNLRILVHRLRLALAGENGDQKRTGDGSPVVSERGWVMLNSAHSWEIDLDRFDSLAGLGNGDAGALEEAAALYRGDPLIEDRYEDWAIPVRERIQRTWREICLQLGNVYQARGQLDLAAQWIDRVLEDDPLDEEATRALLLALNAGGRRTDALRRYSQFQQQLHDEMGVEPSPETLNVAEQLKSAQIEEAAGEFPVRAPRTIAIGRFLGAAPPAPLVGRQEEMERLGLAVDVVEGGAGRLVLLTGETGVGKTRLAQELTVLLRERGFLVATGRCYERDQAAPLYPFLDALTIAYAEAPSSIRSQLSQRWPDLGRLLLGQALSAPVAEVGEAELQGVFRAISDFLAEVATERPVALLIDDLQWADEASIELLQGHLPRAARGERILLAGAYRDAEAAREHQLARAVRELAREGLVERISLGRLTLEETAAVVAETMGPLEDAADFVDFVYRRTKGNPFFIERMLHALGGRYRLIRQLGAGGMGRVFEAVDLRTGTHVAAKMMFARTEADPRALQRFEQEGEVLATLKHPHIVQVYDTILDEYSSCIVMEYLRGRSLGQLLHDEDKPLPLARVRNLAEQVASALAAAHDRGIVHRDIKPDNIMADEDDRVKVTDFGIARMARPHGAMTTLTSTGMTMGTPLYMAPEQIDGRRIDGRADIYSLGAVLYRMVTGRPPFEATDPLTLAYKHVNEAPASPRSLNPALPETWEALILKAMAKDPADRFQTAQAMVDALGALGNGPWAMGNVPVEAHSQTQRVPPTAHGPVEPTAHGLTETEIEHAGKAGFLAGIGAIAVVLAALVLLVVLAVFVRGPSNNSTPTVAPPAKLIWGTQGSGSGQLNGPTGAGMDSHDHLWVADSANHRITEFSSTGKVLATYGAQGSGPGQFENPTDIAVDRSGNIFVADPQNLRIEELSSNFLNENTLQFYGHNPNGFDELTSVAVDNQGNVYATDLFRHRVRTFSPDGTPVLSWGGQGPSVERLSSPDGIAVDSSRGFVYVADRDNDRIEKFTLKGAYLRQFGSKGSGSGQLNQPADLAVDRAGNVYVADLANHRVEEFSQSGRYVAQWGKPGTGYLRFNKPSGIAVDSRGNIYVTDYFNNRIQKIVH